MTKFMLPPGYVERLNNHFHDDTRLTPPDVCQKEVYEYAKRIADKEGLRRVIDIGCGSAYKLLQHFTDCDTVGFELEPTLGWLRNTYPNRTWLESDFSQTLNLGGLVIAADVIEHLPDPDRLLEFIQRIPNKQVVLSTPDRLRLEAVQAGWSALGPPANPAHVREWSFDEFEAYIGKWFTVEEHFISNESQCTQVIYARH